MSDVPYIMETQYPRELWLVDGEKKFRVSRDMYLLLASNGADLPPTRHITELLAENAKLRELVKALHDCTAKTTSAKRCTECALFDGEGGCLDLVRMRELGIEADA